MTRPGPPKPIRARALKRALVLAAATGLYLPATATAHVTVKPPFVEAGVAREIAFETPNERSPDVTVQVSITAPPGFEIVSADAPDGWTVDVSGSTVAWQGGRIEGTNVIAFPVRVQAQVRAGTYQFLSQQHYSDGGIVRWQAALNVLPASGAAAPKQHLQGALLAGLVGTLVIAASLVAIRFLRRRPLQDR